MKKSTCVDRVRRTIRTTSAQLFAESDLRLVARLRDVGVRNCAKFREKAREFVANFVRVRFTVHLKDDRRQPLALCITKDVGLAL